MRKDSKREARNYFLYLDTSEPEAVLGLADLGSVPPTFKVQRWQAHRELSAMLSQKYLNILKQLKIKQSELRGIIVFVGPGSFTGLRIGISFANALAYALNIPIYETKKKEDLGLSKPKKIATPFYGAEPHITKSSRK